MLVCTERGPRFATALCALAATAGAAGGCSASRPDDARPPAPGTPAVGREKDCPEAPRDLSLDHAAVAAALEDAPLAVRGERIVGYYEHGVQTGIKVVVVRPGSLYDLLGLCNGDVLLAVDEIRLSGLGETTAAMDRLEKGSNVRLAILRADVEYRISVMIR
ncbi:MAG TPA: hypothetical protein VG389_14045 [Myxococcota bacterium]|jgi:type II secretory pathway component PulC|nr:hypothetical protein [Myxococcota bacterium]